MATLLLLPSLMLIDHGHFQYNCISLGLVLLAVASILSDRDVLGSALFVAALSHKHMTMYFALAFFAYLFGKCLQQPTATSKVILADPRRNICRNDARLSNLPHWAPQFSARWLFCGCLS